MLVVLLLIGRELVTWYWKVNEALSRLAMIEGVLRSIDKNITGIAQIAHVQHQAAAPPPSQGEQASNRRNRHHRISVHPPTVRTTAKDIQGSKIV